MQMIRPIDGYLSASAYRLFLKIFLWFWLTVLGVAAFALISDRFTGLHVVKQPNIYATVVPILAAQAANAYETGGTEGFRRFTHDNVDDKEQILYLLDGSNQDVLHRSYGTSALHAVQTVKSGQLLTLRGKKVAAYRFVSNTGRPYVLLLYMSTGLGDARQALEEKGVFFLLSLLGIVTFLCLWLAHHIASPVHAIQSAARIVTRGDLTARAPQSILRRKDELASLAMDFNLMVAKIEDLVRSHKDLLAAVSHETRSPLTRLTLSIELLRKEQHESGSDLMDRMIRDIAVLDDLMGQLLTLSRLDTGNFGLRRELVDLGQLVEEVGADGQFEAHADGKDVQVITHASASLQAADHDALRGAFENVLRNAIRFTAPGTTVQIALSVEKKQRMETALITVLDRGPGVPEDMLESIFQPFVRVPTDTMCARGNGLGLAIATSGIHAHEGSLTARNRVDGGLEVVVRLPLP